MTVFFPEQYMYSQSRENAHGFGLYFHTGDDIKEEEEALEGEGKVCVRVCVCVCVYVRVCVLLSFSLCLSLYHVFLSLVPF